MAQSERQGALGLYRTFVKARAAAGLDESTGLEDLIAHHRDQAAIDVLRKIRAERVVLPIDLDVFGD